MSALMARRTYSLLVTPSALAIFSSPRRNSFGKLLVNVSLICKTFLDIPIGNSTLAFFPELQATRLPLQSAHYFADTPAARPSTLGQIFAHVFLRFDHTTPQ